MGGNFQQVKANRREGRRVFDFLLLGWIRRGCKQLVPGNLQVSFSLAFPLCLPDLPAPDFGKDLKAPGERGRSFYSEDAALEGMQHHSWDVLGQASLHLLTSPKGSQLPDFQQNSGWGEKDVLEDPEPEIHEIQDCSKAVAVQPRV